MKRIIYCQKVELTHVDFRVQFIGVIMFRELLHQNVEKYNPVKVNFIILLVAP